jgi:hypothetical protein
MSKLTAEERKHNYNTICTYVSAFLSLFHKKNKKNTQHNIHNICASLFVDLKFYFYLLSQYTRDPQYSRPFSSKHSFDTLDLHVAGVTFRSPLYETQLRKPLSAL